MAQPQFEVLTGTIDGVNTTFTTSVPYTPTTTAVFVSGQLKRPDLDDGWLETDPTTGTIDFKIAPIVGDVLQAFYLDTLPVPAQAGPEPLEASLGEEQCFTADLECLP
jgi:hypothetical protein